jgi:hypothetical protein
LVRILSLGLIVCSLAAVRAADLPDPGATTWRLSGDAAGACRAVAPRGEGGGLALQRDASGLVVLLFREGWTFGAASAVLDVAIDDLWRARLAVRFGEGSIALPFGDGEATVALGSGRRLRILGAAGRMVEADLAGAGTGLAAVEHCFAQRVAGEHRAMEAGGLGPQPGSPPAAAAAARAEIAADEAARTVATFQALLSEAVPERQPQVTTEDEQGQRLAVRFLGAQGRIVPLGEGEAPLLLARGLAQLAGRCGDRPVTIPRERRRGTALALERWSVACAASGTVTELVMLISGPSSGLSVSIANTDEQQAASGIAAAIFAQLVRTVELGRPADGTPPARHEQASYRPALDAAKPSAAPEPPRR